MTEKFIIEGNHKIEGKVRISGGKNNAVAILAATLLSTESFTIDDLPLVEDVLKMIKILESMGAEIEWQDKKKVKIKTEKLDPEKIDYSLVEQMRASVLLIGPLLLRFGKFKMASPGGDRIGLRPIVTHLQALEKLGVKVYKDGSFYHFDGTNLMNAPEITLSEFSVTATENLIMLASGIQGETIIKMAAAEPHVQDLSEMLRDMGAGVEGVGTHTIKIEGKEDLRGVYHKVIPDYLEVGTFFVIGAVTPGTLEMENVVLGHLDAFLAKMEQIGVLFEKGENSLKVSFSQGLKPTKIQALPHPGFPTDLLPVVVPLLTQANGKSLIHDPLYENRLNFIHELRKMGADIEIVDPHRAFVFGKNQLSGIKISSLDIRAGASLVAASLMAEGRTIIENIYQIDRGYEKIDEKLRKLGAKIKRI